LLEKMVEYPNVPRKKAKFFNFIRNSFRSYSTTDSQLNEIWTVIESFDAKPAPSPAQTNGVKRKLEEDTTPPPGSVCVNNKKSTTDQQLKAAAEEANENSHKFNWLESIRKICSKQENGEISLDKLEKKVAHWVINKKKILQLIATRNI
jgi:hypothetical protein